jgi:hypothetical protein
MAKHGIPDPLKRRHVLETDLDATKALAIAEAYLAEGRNPEAVAFLAKADARDRLEALHGEAVAAGDVFLVREISAALGREVAASTWAAVAEGAAAAGKDQYAQEARRLAGALGG